MIKAKSLKFFPRFIASIFFFYLLFIGGLYLLQGFFLYHPESKPFNPSEWALDDLRPIDVATEDGLTLRQWYKAPASKDKLTIVFFQGNTGGFGRRNYKIRSWLDEGYGVYLAGYRGFGNPGTPNEMGLYDDARAAITYLQGIGVPTQALVLYGESLGTGIAAQMATEYEVGGIVLEAPYTSYPDVAKTFYPMVPIDLLMHDRYKTILKMWRIHAPLFLMQGEADRLVPVRMGHAVFDAANTPKQAVFYPTAGHNNIYNDETQKALFDFLNKLPTAVLKETQSEDAGS